MSDISTLRTEKIPDFEALLNSAPYDFLRTDARFGRRIMLLGLSGSYGYGTNRAGSDVDFRGVTLQQPSDLLGLTVFEQYVDEQTDMASISTQEAKLAYSRCCFYITRHENYPLRSCSQHSKF